MLISWYIWWLLWFRIKPRNRYWLLWETKALWLASLIALSIYDRSTDCSMAQVKTRGIYFAKHGLIFWWVLLFVCRFDDSHFDKSMECVKCKFKPQNTQATSMQTYTPSRISTPPAQLHGISLNGKVQAMTKKPFLIQCGFSHTANATTTTLNFRSRSHILMKSEKNSEFWNRLIKVRKCTGASDGSNSKFWPTICAGRSQHHRVVVGVISSLYFPIGSWYILMQLKVEAL